MGPFFPLKGVGPNFGTPMHSSASVGGATGLGAGPVANKVAMGGGSQATGGAVEQTALPETAFAIAASVGSARLDELGKIDHHILETAKARAQSAQRAYQMTAMVLGLNFLNEPQL